MDTKENIKEKLEKKLLSLKELKEVSGGTAVESDDLAAVIDANPYLYDRWVDALYRAYDWEPDDEFFYFTAVGDILAQIGISCTMFDDNGSPNANRYYNKATGAQMSHQQVVEYIRNYRG